MNKRNYIPALEESYRLFTQFDKPYWLPVRRVPIADIKIDKSRMSFANEVCDEMVHTIIHQFDDYQWLPVTVDNENFLLDGQHRLAAAQSMKLKFIDVVVQNNILLKPAIKSKKVKGEF